MVHVATDEVFALRPQHSDLLTCLFGFFKLFPPKPVASKVWTREDMDDNI
jgi:hypothetical protein